MTRSYPLIRLALLALCAFSWVIVAAPTAASETAVETTILPSGLTVVSRQRPGTETASVAVAVRAGGRDEPDSLRGGSHWLEHIHFLGTTRYPTPAALFGEISAAGGDLNARTGTETTTYFVTVPATKLPAAVAVLGEILTRSSFPEAEVERERGVVQEELRGGQRRTGLSIAVQTLAEQLIGTAAQDAGGSVESVEAISRADLLRYRAQHYTARNIVAAVVSPAAHAEVVALVARAFEMLPSGQVRVRAPQPPAVEGVHLEGYTPFEPVIIAGQRIPGLDAADAAALQVMDAVLDVPGTRMEDALRDARAATQGGTLINQLSDTGTWMAFGIAPPSRADQVLEVIRAQVRRLQTERTSDAEVQAATRFLAGRVLLGSERGAAQATQLASQTALGVYQTEEHAAARILAVTADDVQRVARRYLDPDLFSVLVQE